MKDKVYIKIRGLHMNEDAAMDEYDDREDTIEVISVGSYKVINNKAYIRYEEPGEAGEKGGTSTIKIDGSNIELTKKGSAMTHMSFVKGEKTMTCYETPFGNVYLGIFTRVCDIERTNDRISVHIEYGIEVNYEEVSDCTVDIEISSVENNAFRI